MVYYIHFIKKGIYKKPFIIRKALLISDLDCIIIKLFHITNDTLQNIIA